MDRLPFEVAYVVGAEDVKLPRKDFDEPAEGLGLDKVIDIAGDCNSSLGRYA